MDNVKVFDLTKKLAPAVGNDNGLSALSFFTIEAPNGGRFNWHGMNILWHIASADITATVIKNGTYARVVNANLCMNFLDRNKNEIASVDVVIEDGNDPLWTDLSFLFGRHVLRELIEEAGK